MHLNFAQTNCFINTCLGYLKREDWVAVVVGWQVDTAYGISQSALQYVGLW